MTAYFDTDKALLGDFVDSSKFETITAVATHNIRVGRGLTFDYDAGTRRDFLLKEYDNISPAFPGKPMVGVAFRDRSLIASPDPAAGPDVYINVLTPGDEVSVVIKGRIYVNAEIGANIEAGAKATISTTGEFNTTPGELIVGKWLSSGVSTTGDDLFALQLDLYETAYL